MNSIIIVLFCLVFLAIEQGIDGINCYSCDAGTDGCGTSFKKTGAGVIPTSDSSPVYCTKTVYTSNTNAIMRDYETVGTCIEGSSTTSGITSYQYCCTTDLCNEASMGKANFIFAVISAVIGLLLIK